MATRTIGTEIVLTGEKAFNDAMKGVNSNLKNLRADMALVSAEFDGNADSIEALTAKEKVLQSSVEQHRAKVDALQKMYDRQKDKFGENSDAADKYRLQLTQATAALVKEENALKKTTVAISDKKAAEIAAKESARAAEKAALEQARAAEEQAKAAEDQAKAAEKLAKEQKAAAEAAEAAAKKQKDFSEKLEKSQKRAEAFKGGLEKLGKAAGSVAKATAASVAAIAAAGGVALVGMVNMAKEAAEAAKTAHEAGEELTDSQQQWLAFSGQLDALSGSTANAKSAIAGILLPMLGDLATEGTSFLNDFVRDMTAAAGDTGKQTEILGQYIANGAKLIMEKLPEYIKAGKDILGGVMDGFSENSDELLDMGLDLIMDLLKFIMDSAPALADAGIELVLQLIEGIEGQDLADSASQMVGKIVSGLAAAAPKLIPAAMDLVIDLVTGLVKNFPMLLKGGADLVMGILEGIFSALGELGEAGMDLIRMLIDSMRNSDSEFLQWGADVIEKIIDGIAAAWDGLVSWFNDLWDGLFSGRSVDVDVNGSSNVGVDGSHASGLRYVPFDGYLAELHRGEAVLTASEASAYRSGQGSGSKEINVTINAKTISKEDLDMLVDYMNRKLGDGL